MSVYYQMFKAWLLISIFALLVAVAGKFNDKLDLIITLLGG